MFYRTVLLAAVALTGAVNAQSRNETGTGPEIDPNSVPISERQGWCRIQTQNCPRICGGRTSGNTCDPVTLTFSCICGDGNSPNTSDYEQTLPAYVCREYIEQCVVAHPDDREGIAACRATECGNQTELESSSSTSSSATSSQTASSTSSSGDSEASETASSTSDSSGDDSASQTADSSAASETADADSAAAALNLASNYGTGLLAAGILAAFGFAL